jgi:hypothetical protein
MAKPCAIYFGAVGFLIVVVGLTLEHLLPGTATFLDRLPQWLCPLGFADMTSAPWWSVMLGGAIERVAQSPWCWDSAVLRWRAE